MASSLVLEISNETLRDAKRNSENGHKKEIEIFM